MSSYKEGQIHQLADRLEEEGFAAEDITKLGQYGDLFGLRGVLRGTHEIREVGKLSVSEPAEKFALLVDLGIIVVPENYMYGTCLGTFFKANGKKLYDYNKNITDANFPNPSRILKPGDRVRVRAFHQIVPGKTTSEERMAFLEKQPGNFYAGAQGLVHVFEQKRDQLPKGKWYASFDKKDHLWEDSDGNHRVPRVGANSGGDFNINLGCLENAWHVNDALLSFSDIIVEPSES